MSSSAWPVWQHSSAVIGSSAAHVPSPLADFTYRRDGIDVVADFTYCRNVPGVDIHFHYNPQQVSYISWRRDSQWAYHIQSEGFFNSRYIRATICCSFGWCHQVNRWKVFNMQCEAWTPSILHDLYTLSFIYYKSFWGYWYLVWAVSPLLLWASTWNFTTISVLPSSLSWFMTSAMPTH